jgi:hypothetical protein
MTAAPWRSAAEPALGDDAVGIVGIVTLAVVLAILAVALILVRRVVVGSARGAFECHVRRPFPGETRSWRSGIARYEGTRISIFALVSLAWWPTVTLYRDRLTVLERRQGVDEVGAPILPSGPATVLRCRYDDRLVDLAMDDLAAGGFSVWVESGPPGRGVNVA